MKTPLLGCLLLMLWACETDPVRPDLSALIAGDYYGQTTGSYDAEQWTTDSLTGGPGFMYLKNVTVDTAALVGVRVSGDSIRLEWQDFIYGNPVQLAFPVSDSLNFRSGQQDYYYNTGYTWDISFDPPAGRLRMVYQAQFFSTAGPKRTHLIFQGSR